MRKIIFFAVFIFIHGASLAQDSVIVWKQAGYKQMLATAKGGHKDIMICLYPDSTQTCYMDIKLMISMDKKISQFCNAHFFTFAVNPDEGEGPMLSKKFELRRYPCFVYLDSAGNMLHKHVGWAGEAKFLEEGKKAASKKLTYSELKMKYENGDRTPAVLRNYCYTLRNAYEEDSARIKPIIDGYFATQSAKELGNPKNMKFIYDFAVAHHKTMLSYDSKAFQFLYKNENSFVNNYKKSYLDARIVFVLYDNAIDAATHKNEKKLDSVLSLIRKYDNGKEWDWKEENGGITAWLSYPHLVSYLSWHFYQDFGDKQKYLTAFNAFAKDIWDDENELNSLAWSCYESCDDPDKLNNALKCGKRSVELKPSAYNIDTYASLLYKTGHYEQALANEQQALELAKKGKIDTKPYTELIDKINARLSGK